MKSLISKKRLTEEERKKERKKERRTKQSLDSPQTIEANKKVLQANFIVIFKQTKRCRNDVISLDCHVTVVCTLYAKMV